MQTKCPIAWKIEDGPYPCAFKNGFDNCSRVDEYTSCIPTHLQRYNIARMFVATKCPECGIEIDNTIGNREKGIFPMCHSCSEMMKEGFRLTDHIRGDCR